MQLGGPLSASQTKKEEIPYRGAQGWDCIRTCQAADADRAFAMQEATATAATGSGAIERESVAPKGSSRVRTSGKGLWGLLNQLRASRSAPALPNLAPAAGVQESRQHAAAGDDQLLRNHGAGHDDRSPSKMVRFSGK